MSFVIDSTGPVSPSAMRAAGVSGTVRYVGAGSSWKHASHSEVQSYLDHGLTVAFVTEGGTGMALGGYNAGFTAARDGLAAASYALGHPARAIYMACDTDTSYSSTAEFWRGGANAVGSSRLGAYGPRRVVAGALDSGHVKYGWQPEAWSSGVDSRVQLHQHTRYVTIGGVQCDYNEVRHADYGQFPFSGSVPVPPVKPPVVPEPAYHGPWVEKVESAFHMI